MTKRLDYSKANRERKMRTQGAEGIDDLGTADQARGDYRDGVKERHKKWIQRGISHDRIEKQARSDFEAKKAGTWKIVDAPVKLATQAARKTAKQKRRGSTKAK